MSRLYAGIPNAAFLKVVRLYAFEKGRPIFTVQEQYLTFLFYTEFAKILN